ncbi:MAG: phage holin family protein [Oscillospiraceae bacterium]|nr:phage holin family protein [Oscillospiraceae bacterium]
MNWDKITKAVAAACGAAAGMLGGWTMLLTILAWFMGIDYLTGLLVAWRGRSPKTEHGGVSSKVGFDGLIRKAFIMLVVLMATLLDRAIGNSASVFQTAATMYYIANEGISILENTSIMGVKYPAFILKALETMREKADKGGEPEDEKAE